MNALKPKVSVIFQKRFAAVRFEPGQRVSDTGCVDKILTFIFRSECQIGEKEGSCTCRTRWRSVTNHLCWKFTIRGKRINVEFTLSTISWLQKKELCSSKSSYAPYFEIFTDFWNYGNWAFQSRPLPSGGKAFIDFAEPQQAASAKTALQGFKVTPEKAIQLTFAKN